MSQLVQLAGAITILVAFIASQAGKLATDAWAYILLNFIGGILLAILAFLDRDWGFLLLEGVWALVSGWAGVRKAMSGRADLAGVRPRSGSR